MPNSVVQYLDRNRQRHLDELKSLLAIPSVSTDPAHRDDVARAADWVQRRLLDAGCTAAQVQRTAGHPIVYGEWLGAPGGPTILVYGHYDVQPPDPLELWQTPPFQPTVRDGKLYARGASDDKGQVIVHINALEAHLQNGGCPVNLKFLIEGEEEIGSKHLEPFLKQNRKQLQCDAVVVSDTAMFGKGTPSICYGLRGLAYLEVTVRGTDRDLHSGTYGGAVVNPANALVEILARLKDARGRITVPGFYENVDRLKQAERDSFARLPHSDARFKRSIGAPELSGESGFTTLERIWTRPTLDINGIWAGFTGKGAKTVIPAVARAKISMRLVPRQRPEEIERKVIKQIKKLAPRSVEVSVESLHGGETWVAPTDHAALQAAARALQSAFGKRAVFVREGGSIPIVASFERILKVPTVLMGIGLNDDNLHAPNEKLDLDNFYRGIRASAFLLDELRQALGHDAGRPRASGQRSR